MSKRTTFIIVDAKKWDFFTAGGGWSSEYPNARLFSNLQDAKRTRDKIVQLTDIYDCEAYEQGQSPIVSADNN